MWLMSLVGRAAPRPFLLRTPENDWGWVIERLAGGDQQALAELYDQTSRLVYSVALRILGNQEDAEEVTSDVYAQAWRSAGEYTSGRGSPSTWLVMMTRSRALDRLRSRSSRTKREAILDEAREAADSGVPPEQGAILGQQQKIVREALAQLAPEQRVAIEMSYFEGLTHTELAEKLGQPLGTVKTRIRIGINKLREALSAGKGVQ